MFTSRHVTFFFCNNWFDKSYGTALKYFEGTEITEYRLLTKLADDITRSGGKPATQRVRYQQPTGTVARKK